MSETSTRSRVNELLAEARKALDLRERLAREDNDPSEVDEVLEGLYRDIGAALVEAGVQDAMIPDLPTGGLVESFTNELPGYEDDGSWYTDERDQQVADHAGGPLFEPGELDESTDVPEADHISVDRSVDETDPGPGEFAVETTAGLGVLIASNQRSGLAQLRVAGAGIPWRQALEELLELLALPAGVYADVGSRPPEATPGDPDDGKELGVEASRVQWAASEIAYRLKDYPTDVRICLVGLLAARAQHLRAKLDVDVGLRTSLDRLQRYRIDMDLPSVAGLLPNPTPEHGTWAADVRAWWELLRPPADVSDGVARPPSPPRS